MHSTDKHAPMTCTDTATCQACGWRGRADDTRELRDVWDRVQPGDIMPAGECPVDGCHGAAMLDRPPPAHADHLQFQPVCETCGSTSVLLDAWAAWSVEARSWELHSTMQMAFCQDCDGQTSLLQKPASHTPTAANHPAPTGADILHDFKASVATALAGRPMARIATAAGLPRDAIRSVLIGHDPKLSRAADICHALGLELNLDPAGTATHRAYRTR